MANFVARPAGRANLSRTVHWGLGDGAAQDAALFVDAVSNYTPIVRNAVVERIPAAASPIPMPVELTSIRNMVTMLATTESSAIATANRAITLHNAGKLSAADYVTYDTLRHQLNGCQVAFLTGLRSALNAALGVAASSVIMARITPNWPGWLPALERGDRHIVAPIDPSEVNGVSGLRGGLGLAPLAIAGIVLAAIAGVAIAVYFGSHLVAAMVKAYTTFVTAKQLDSVMIQRERIYNQCTSQGGSPEQCATAAANLTTDIVALLRDLNKPPEEGTSRWLTIGLPVLLVMALAAGGGVWWWKKKHKGGKHSGKSGTSLFGVRPRRLRAHPPRSSTSSKRSRKGVGAIPLKTLSDPVKSRYMLEV